MNAVVTREFEAVTRAVARCGSAVAVVTVLFTATTLHAGFTDIEDSPDEYNEPNLLGVNPFPGNPNPSVLETLYGESNLRRVDDSRDVYFRHTGIEATAKMMAKFSIAADRFGFTGSNGLFRPVLWAADHEYIGYFPVRRFPEIYDGVIELADSGKVFVVRAGSLASSVPDQNYEGLDLMVTFEIVDTVDHPENSVGNIVVAFEDNPRLDRDYQDLVIEMTGVTSVPEGNASLMLIFVVAGYWSCVIRL